MNTLTTAFISRRRTKFDLAVWARQIGIALYALALAALESWLRFPILPLFEGYLRSSMSRIWSVAAAVSRYLSLPT